MIVMGYAGEAWGALTWLTLGFTGCFRDGNPQRMSQGLVLELALEILLDYIKEVLMSESIWSVEIGVRYYLDDVVIFFTLSEKNWAASYLLE